MQYCPLQGYRMEVNMKRVLTMVMAMMLLSSSVLGSYSISVTQPVVAASTIHHPSQTPTSELIKVLKPTLDPELAKVHAKYIDMSANKWGIKRELVISIAFRESEFNSCAISSEGAVGVMQIMRSAHKDKIESRRIKPNQVFELKHNYDIGCEILHEQRNKTLDGKLKAYVGGNQPKYVADIKRNMRRLSAYSNGTNKG